MQTSLVTFCGFVFDRQQGTISLNDEAIHLEHQQAKILNLLIENKEAIVSREQIAEEVWQGIIVEDNTISKAITRLRKVLNDDAKSSQIIKTVPKKGYQFIASIEDISKQQVPDTVQASTSAEQDEKANKWTAILGGLVIFIATVVFINATDEQSTRSFDSDVSTESLPKPISFREGVELNAHLHADNTQLLFVGDVEAGYALFTKNIGDANDTELFPVTSRLIYPKWLDIDSTAFVYSDLDDNGQCQIFKGDVSNVASRTRIATCVKTTPVEVFVNDATNSIFWSDDAGSWQQDILTAERKSLTFGNQDAKFQMPSPNGERWASVKEIGEHSLLKVFDIETRQVLLEKQISYVISHVKWSASGDALYHLGEHPANQLYRISIGGEQSLLASTSLGTMTRISDIQSATSVEFVISSLDVDVHQFKGGEESKLINSPFSDYNPVMSDASGLLAFASKRTGSAQVWVKGEGDKLMQVSDFARASYIFDIAWSPDESQLLVKRNDSIYVFDLTTNQSKELPIDASNKVDWQWISNQQIAYVDHASQSLFRFDISTQNTELLKPGVTHAHFDLASQNWTVSDPVGESLWQYNLDFTEQTQLTDKLNKRQWLASADKLYVVNRSQGLKPHRQTTLVALLPSGEEQVILEESFNPLSIRATASGVLVYHRTNRNEANIYQLSLQ